MGKIDGALRVLNAMERGTGNNCPRYATPVWSGMMLTLLYLCAMLSVPLQQVGRLIWFASFPIVWASVSGIGYGPVLRRSLLVLPFIVFVGIFNPVVDRAPAFIVGDMTISRGWVSFSSIVLRGLFSVQTVLVLTGVCGFADICRGLRRMGVPGALVTQLQLMYRYLGVLLEELQTMKRAREARGYGRRSYPMRMWAVMAGQLFLRSVDRAGRIHRAMLARGFDGEMPRFKSVCGRTENSAGTYIWVVIWVSVFLWLRFGAVDSMFNFIRQ